MARKNKTEELRTILEVARHWEEMETANRKKAEEFKSNDEIEKYLSWSEQASKCGYAKTGVLDVALALHIITDKAYEKLSEDLEVEKALNELLQREEEEHN